MESQRNSWMGGYCKQMKTEEIITIEAPQPLIKVLDDAGLLIEEDVAHLIKILEEEDSG